MSKERLDNSVLDNAISTYKTVGEVAGNIIDEDYSPVLDNVTLVFLEELKQYRDLEEQGLLLRLPCKIGCTVYEIIEESVPYHHYYIGEYQVQDVSAKAVKYCGDWIELDSENVYFSKEEARRALKKMESEEYNSYITNDQPSVD